jgi:hypothetical protein
MTEEKMDNVNDSGFIYVLINVSMDGLVKIGKTQRDPEKRAIELSSATGVPTPFIVAFEAFFIVSLRQACLPQAHTRNAQRPLCFFGSIVCRAVDGYLCRRSSGACQPSV